MLSPESLGERTLVCMLRHDWTLSLSKYLDRSFEIQGKQICGFLPEFNQKTILRELIVFAGIRRGILPSCKQLMLFQRQKSWYRFAEHEPTLKIKSIPCSGAEGLLEPPHPI